MATSATTTGLLVAALVALAAALAPASSTASSSELVTCSLCLRVRRGSAWIEAEAVIRELRSHERDTLPRLLRGVCDDCADAILERRA